MEVGDKRHPKIVNISYSGNQKSIPNKKITKLNEKIYAWYVISKFL